MFLEEKHVDDSGFKGAETEMIGIDLIPGTGKTDTSAKSYSIVMSLEETVVLQVCEELTDMLGYPKVSHQYYSNELRARQ